jgi:hypothetical protein
MIDRQHGHVLIHCDACEETYEGNSDDFYEVWPAAKRDGWRTRKIAEEWVHTCPECSQ